ncbi:MAG: DUF3667 domain-containing protein [Alloprevotella sp.]
MKLIQKIRQGTFTQKRITQPDGTQHCMNCGNDFQGAYCPRCGQSHTTRRITWHNFWRTFVMNGIGLQGTLPRTLLELFYRPGFLIRDYLAGKRQHYINPFRCLLLLAAIFVLLSNTPLVGDLKATTSEFGASVSQGLYTASAQEQAATKMMTDAMTELIYANFGTFNLCLILVMTFPFWLVFRRQGQFRAQPLNLSEAATSMAFVGCQNMVLNVLSLPFLTTVDMGVLSLVSYSVVVPLFVMTLWQMFDMPPGRFLLRFLLLSIFSLFVYIVLVYTIVFYIVFTRMM